MKKYILIIFILLIRLTHADSSASDATIVIYKDTAESGKVSGFFSDLYKKIKFKSQDIPVEVDASLLSLANFSAGAILDVKDIPPIEIHHDIDKIYSNIHESDGVKKLSYWNRIRVGAKLCVPAYFSIPNILGPIGLNLGGEVGIKQEYTFTLKTNQLMQDDDTIVESLLNKFGRSLKSAGKIRIPMSAKAILKKYPMGAEIATSSNRYLITKLGVNVGIMALSANIDYYALIEGKIETNLKILYDKNKKLIEYTVNNRKSMGNEVSESVGLGLTLFETSWINGSLRVNLLSSKLSTVKSSGIYFDYIYDISYPEAETALNEAIHGNLIPSEKIAIFRGDEDKFKGVIVNAKRTDVLYETLKSYSIGFVANESALSSYVGSLKAKETFGGFLYNIGSTTNSEIETTTNSYLNEKNRIKSFNWKENDSSSILFGLLTKYDKKVNVKSEILTSETVFEGVGQADLTINKISYSYQYHDYKNGKKVEREFYKSALRVLGNNNKPLKEAILESSKNNVCSSDATIKINGTFYDRAILNILFYEENELWSMVGRALNIKPASLLRYEKTRSEYINKLQKEYYKKRRYLHSIMVGPYEGDYLEKLRDEYPELVNGIPRHHISSNLQKNVDEIKLELDRIKKFGSKFLPAWRVAKENHFKDREELAQNLKKLFNVYGLDTFGFELLTLLAGFDYQSEKDRERYAQGIYTSFSLNSGKCNFNWIQMGDIQYRIGDITRSWE